MDQCRARPLIVVPPNDLRAESLCVSHRLVPVGHGERNVPARRLARSGGRDPGDRILEAGRGGHPRLPRPDARIDCRLKVVTITGPADHRREAEVIDLPAKGILVERHSRPGVTRVEIAEIPSTRLVTHLRPWASPGPPEAELNALRI